MARENANEAYERKFIKLKLDILRLEVKSIKNFRKIGTYTRCSE